MSNGKGGSSGVPEGWQSKQLGQIVGDAFQNGLYKPSTAYGEGFPIVRINDFDNNGKFTSDKFQRLSVDLLEAARYQILEGDILINRVNSLSHIGKSVLVGKLVEPTVYESNMMRLRVPKEEIQADFLAYLLQTNGIREHFKKVAKKAVAQASINQDDLKSLEVSLPPLEEQRKIADILSAWDESIEQQTRLLELKRERKRGLMQQLLTGKVRFKEFEGLEWEVSTVGRCATFYNGRAFKPSDWSTSGLPIIRIQNLNGSKDFNFFQGDYDQKNTALTGELLFSWSGSRGTSFGPAIWQGGTALINQHIFKVEPKKLVDKAFFYYQLRLLTIFIENRAHGSAGLVHVTKGELEKEPLMLPSLPEQKKIATVLSAADKEIETLEAQLSALRSQKRGLMQRLLTGKTRVKLA